jgi:5-methylcytosine-specific restriction enzyme subunit McrC
MTEAAPARIRSEVSINEWSSSPPLDLTDRDLEMIDSEINANRNQLDYVHHRDGTVSLETTHYVGIVSLPDGPTVEIRPKAAGDNLLSLFRYAQGIDAATIERETAVPAGREFVDALAAVFLDELSTVVRRGLFTEYQRTRGTEEHLRGQLDVQRQLQRQGTTGTAFECNYDELTADTTANRAILYATSVLARLVASSGLSQALRRYQSQLRRQVTLTPVDVHSVEQIELSRLNEHYADLLRLAELVIRGLFIQNFVSGERPTFAILMDMNRVFEAVVERAAREAVSGYDGWTVEGQAHVKGLVTGGKHPVRMRPDFVVRDDSETVQLVGDAKWKVGTPSQADIYQLTAYQLADDVPGLLVYPSQGGSTATQYTVRGQFALRLIELPTDAEVDSYNEFGRLLEEKMLSEISSKMNFEDNLQTGRQY